MADYSWRSALMCYLTPAKVYGTKETKHDSLWGSLQRKNEKRKKKTHTHNFCQTGCSDNKKKRECNIFIKASIVWTKIFYVTLIKVFMLITWQMEQLNATAGGGIHFVSQLLGSMPSGWVNPVNTPKKRQNSVINRFNVGLLLQFIF